MSPVNEHKTMSPEIRRENIESDSHTSFFSLQQCLLHHMGDEKYQAYAVMVRQLKFLEDVAFKV